MNQHTKAILIFGGLPSIVILVVLVVGFYAFQNGLETEKRKRRADYRTYQHNMSQIAVMENFLGKEKRREKMAFLDSHLDRDLLQTLSTNLAEILSQFEENEIQNTAIGRPTGSSQIAALSESRYSKVNLVFEGRYGAIQKTIAELEFRMPQLTLESLNLAPSRGTRNDTSPQLKIELNYICWHRPEAS